MQVLWLAIPKCASKSSLKDPDKDSALMVAEQSEWMDINGNHYCPDCYELDEVTDEYVPKKGDNNE